MIPMLEENAAGTVCGLVPPFYAPNKAIVYLWMVPTPSLAIFYKTK